MNAHVRPPAHEAYWFLNTRAEILRSHADGRDGITILAFDSPPNEGPPTHVHHDEDEIFHVTEGAMLLRVGDKETLVTAGMTVVAPKGVPHVFRVVSPEGARGVAMTTGGGFEGLVRRLGRAPAHAGLPEFAVPTPEMQAELAKAAEENGISIVGPPLA